MAIKEILSQERPVALLQRAFLAGRVPHAYIFAGPQGVGKFTTARQWAKLLLCRNPVVAVGSADSCGACESCRAVEADAHPDFSIVYKELVEFVSEPKGRKTPVDLPIDVIREFLVEKASARPTLSRRKVFVVREAEKLNASSQNCLLKVLEEPPEYCCIILLCTRTERLLPTTRSRCQIVRFGPVDEQTILNKLKQMGVKQTQAKYFARLAQGSLGLACRWAQLQAAELNLYQTKTELVNALANYEFADVIELGAELLDKSKAIATVWMSIETTTSKTDINRKAAKTVVQIIISALYDAMRLNVTPEERLINFDQKGQIERLRRRFDTKQSAQRIADCYRILRWIEAGVNEKLIFEQLLFNLAGSDTMRV